jgi:hypothetical protein
LGLQLCQAQDRSFTDIDRIKWKNYSTNDKLLRVRVPESWICDETFMSFNLFLKAPYESEADKFAENMSIYFQDLPGNSPDFNLNAYISEAKMQIVKLLGEVKMSEPRYFSLRGNPAGEFTCINEQDGFTLKWKQVCQVKGSRIFTFTFTSTVDDFAQYVQIADIIMQSVEIR